MSQIQPNYDDEINIFDILKSLWVNKWLICTFVATSILFGAIYTNYQKTTYSAKIFYSVDTIPYFFNENKVLNDFKEKFFSESVFNDWKNKNNGDVSIGFDDFKITKIVNGYEISKNEGEKLVTFVTGKKIVSSSPLSFISIKTNELSTLDEFFTYANYINKKLKNEYVVRSNEELKFVEKRFTKASIIFQTVLSLERFIVSANKGANVLVIQHPTTPEKISPRFSRTLIGSIFIGGVISLLIVLINYAIKRLKN